MMGSSIKELVQQEMNLKILKPIGRECGGDTCEGNAYETDSGKIFVKRYTEPDARQMFEGEFVSLEKMQLCGVVRVPEPLKVIDFPGRGGLFVMEYLDLQGGLSRFSQQLGTQLARMHLKNGEDIDRKIKNEGHVKKDENDTCVEKFGFDVPTCCGRILNDNGWEDDWVTFYAKRIDAHIKLVEKHYGDKEVRELWSKLLPNLHKLFEGLNIKPALLHGDLWGGNVAEMVNEPVIYDPASFYGHSEFDLAIAHMFGGFPRDFFDSYHSLIPKAEGFETRLKLYQFFHYINHWNIFGTGYKSSTLRSLRCVANSVIK